MAARKPTSDEGKSQRQKFIEAAREHGADGTEDAFRSALRKIATAPAPKPKKAGKSRR